MKISIISVFPEVHETFLSLSLIGRAVAEKRIEFNLVRFSDYCEPKERIDQPTCGPGAGMILKPEVVERAIVDCQAKWGPGYKIFFSPQGQKMSQPMLRRLAQRLTVSTNPVSVDIENNAPHLILVCSRYEGMDARVEQYFADQVISIGDYVIMGGDLPAQVLLEALLRLIPGIVGNWSSVEQDSFSGAFLDHPEYSLPVDWHDMQIPEIVRSGNHAVIEKWRTQEAAKKTILKRFDWFSAAARKPEDIALARTYIPPHYVALMHTQVKLKDGIVGNTSIVSLDLHDTARSCITYGIKNFFMVSPLEDQQIIMGTFLEFWNSDEGKNYNPSRYQAVSRVKPAYNLDEVIQAITLQEGVAPIIITTSANPHQHDHKIDFFSQSAVWEKQRPVLLLFGTGRGLADELVKQSDFLLVPIAGMYDYKHLSVRSAIAIALDRWLGLQTKIE